MLYKRTLTHIRIKICEINFSIELKLWQIRHTIVHLYQCFVLISKMYHSLRAPPCWKPQYIQFCWPLVKPHNLGHNSKYAGLAASQYMYYGYCTKTDIGSITLFVDDFSHPPNTLPFQPKSQMDQEGNWGLVKTRKLDCYSSRNI